MARRPFLVTLCSLLLLVLSACGGSTPAAGGGTTAPPASSSAESASAAPATPSPTEDPVAQQHEALVAAALAGLDRRQQIAQLFVVGVPLDGLAAADGMVRDTRIGGVFLRGRSSIAAADLAAVTAGWTQLSPALRPWIAADQEGGAVQTLRGPGFGALPPAVEQGRLPLDQLAPLADGLGASLASAGINLDLAPVADVVPAGTEARNAPIGAFGRQYGSTVATAVPAIATVVDGLAAHGVTATLKHFPGLGRVVENTDDAPATDTVTTRGDEQVTAFGTLARSPAAPFVMMASATYTQIDPSAPAAFSPVVVTDVLRGDLGFDGVVISDDLGVAEAVQDIPAGDRAVRFLAAGGTLVLTVSGATLPEMLDAVVARDAADPAFAATIDAAVHTALLAKARAGLLG
ncbi:glycoside hydrolase family 3 N-terminal domain-containing protein [Blastococcus sp. SYSU D00820]